MAGCAFRQSRHDDESQPAKPDRVRRVLVVLASSLDEYAEMLAFVAEAFQGSDQEDIRIRPHPEFPFSLTLAPQLAGIRYHVSSGSLSEDLCWADVVMYASSTVSMESVVRGIPVIYVDVGHVINADPLFERTDGLKWAPQQPADVRPCLRAMESLTAEDYQRRFEADRAHIDQYLQPPDEHRIQTLVEIARCQKSFA